MDTETVATATTDEDPAYREARQKAEAIQGLYIHFLVYLVINAGLFGSNWLTRAEGGSWWFIWPLAGWGIALVIHVLVTIVPVFSEDWADRRARRMLGGTQTRG